MMMRSNAGFRGMTLLVLLLVSLVALSAGCGRKAESDQKYHCPMHPTYVTDRPGDCPICGMKVVPIPPAKTAPPPATGVTSRPSGSASAPGAAPAEHRLLFYRNPMDPTVTSPVPMKDPMGMDYVPVYSDDGHGAATEVPGYATVSGDAAAFERAGVRVAIAESGRLGHAARAVGEVRADETRIRQVSLKNGGWVEKLFVNANGQSVRKGMPLLSLYSPELVASQEEYLQVRESAARFAASELPEVRKGGEDLRNAARRRLELFDVPPEFIAELERSGRPSRTLTLNAPYGGFVTAKDVFEGARVESGATLFTITDLSHVWVLADIYEYEARSIHLDQAATLSPAYDASVVIPARVGYIYPYLNAESRTLRVRFEVENPGQVLKPGMFANVRLSADETDGILVPDAAVMDTGTRQLVFVETSPGTFSPRSVVTGPRANGQALLISGIRAGERVVVAANFLLDSESKLRAALARSTPADTMESAVRK